MNSNYRIFVAGLTLGVALTAVAAGCGKFKRSALVVREPAAPGESSLSYTPPPRPSQTELVSMLSGDAGSMITVMLTPKVNKIRDGVYLAIGYDLGSVAMIETSEGLVIVDSTTREEAARKILAEFRKITRAPIRYIIYTHFHPDHTQGAAVFREPGTKIIATESFLYWNDYQNRLLGQHHLRSRSTQAGVVANEYGFDIPMNPMRGLGLKPEIIPPDITFKDTYEFSLGGKIFKLFATAGETEDHLAIWMPAERTLFVGDLYYHSFPNLSTPMLESRPVQGWIASLDKFIALQPDFLVPQHTSALAGRELIAEHLTNYRDAIKYVHDETVRAINEGKTVDEAAAEIKLPDHLAQQPYLGEYYGRVSWSVRGIYHGYKGWYDGLGTGLNPLPPEHRARELVALAGGADKILARAIALQAQGEHQLCAELCDVAIAANPADRLAHRIKAESMIHLAYGLHNLNCVGFYRSAFSLEMKAAGGPPNREK
jgi:alkyl sulfatase BDS1-like metallo-beta-lactamase superfamily hydrolase